jgi:transposase
MENIARLMMELPKDYEEDCYTQKAIVRKRGVSNPADLMMLAMFHLQNGCSLLEMSEVARITKLGKMSDVAFMKRFEQCGNWFRSINEKMAAEDWINYQKPAWMEDKTVIAVDASDVTEKGRSGRIYRLHFAFDIFSMNSAEHKITTNKIGESLCNFTLKPGHIIVADRGYSSIKGIKHCNNSGAEYILRIRKNSFTVKNEFDEKIDLLELFSKLNSEECADLSAFATNSEGEKIAIRICAKRKTPESAMQTQMKLKRKESKKQCVISEEAKIFNEYIIVVTNLDDSISADDILETYRLRWQVEIYFKRLKSILNFGELPKRRPDSVIAWLNGKLMVSLLIERVIGKASFPPQGQNKQERLA